MQMRMPKSNLQLPRLAGNKSAEGNASCSARRTKSTCASNHVWSRGLLIDVVQFSTLLQETELPAILDMKWYASSAPFAPVLHGEHFPLLGAIEMHWSRLYWLSQTPKDISHCMN